MNTIALTDDEMKLLIYAVKAARSDEYEFSQGNSERLTLLAGLQTKLVDYFIPRV